ncbi:hypothetical protein P167DRAFT_548621 [Morchella conica CCBAS932]|uniref:Uncharacterized protein n=1 Tax=Morchella conica CCBAS932 TaxID=1392247 RepID=A0A3N4KSW7_9PEZI|nr:hypothetical protein P167DRAFT_548621 [Morchella conica CCBAS932]
MHFSGFPILQVFLFLLLITPALINAAAAPTTEEEMIKHISRGAKPLIGTPNAIPGEMEERDLEGNSPPPPSDGEDINAPKGGGRGGGGGGGRTKSGGSGSGAATAVGTSGATAVKVGSLGALVVAAAGAVKSDDVIVNYVCELPSHTEDI